MAGMQTRLHLIANEPGTYDGISASYSGPGFSGMKFSYCNTGSRRIRPWVAKAKQSPNSMSDMAAFENWPRLVIQPGGIFLQRETRLV